MGKGKRNKAKRKVEKEWGVKPSVDLPAYDEATYMQEYEASGYNFAVFRKHTYLMARKDPKDMDAALETGMMKAIEEQNIVIDSDGTMRQA